MEQTIESPVHGKIQINCAFSGILEPSELKPNPKNPNTHPEKQIDLFEKILIFNGFRRAIVVSKRSGFVTKGHGALLAAKSMGLNGVPVDYQPYDSEDQEVADMVADNQLAEWSEIDKPKLQDLLQQLNTGKFDLEVTGFDAGSLEKMLAAFASGPSLELSSSPDSPSGAEAPASFESPVDAPGLGDASHVRMVQLFLSEKTLPEFESLIAHFRAKLGTENITDTILGVLRNARTEDNQPQLSAPEGDVGSVLGGEALEP